jgi:SNF2 family DNA or RNA helicase
MNIMPQTHTDTRTSATANPVNVEERKYLGGKPYPYRGVPFPFKHQVETANFVVNTPRCFVLDEIGTGKSWSVTWAIDFLIQTGQVHNILIVAPLSTMEIVWLRTFFHLNASLDVDVLKGTAAKRKFLLGRPGLIKVSIINPDAVHIIADDPAIKDYDMVVVDESAMFRNATARRVKALQKICKDMKRVVMMTGSPCPEAPTDIWATAKIVCPERVPKFFGAFRDLTMKKITTFKWVPLKNAQETIAKLLTGFTIRHKRDDCIDLPPSQTLQYELEPSKTQADVMREIRKSAVAMLEDGSITAVNEAVLRGKLLQVASGAVKYHDDDGNAQVYITEAKSKFDALEELLDSATQPIIVFSQYTAVIRLIEEWLTTKKIPHAMIDGSVPASRRLEHFDDLQSGMLRVLVAHPSAMAHGITLTTANIIVWWSPIDSQEITEQANGRIVRPGQVRNSYFIYLTCSSLESKVLARLDSKQSMQGVLLDYLQNAEN